MRIGIVDDMALARETLRRVVTSVPHNEVAWLAANGAEAIDNAHHDKPDLILMDLVMPILDGVEATRRIMLIDPCPILIVTSSSTGNFKKVYEAMGHGALDVVDTPTLGPKGDLHGASNLLTKIEIVGKLIGKGRKGVQGTGCRPSPRKEYLVAIGASTGGPSAVTEVLNAIPKECEAAIVIVQHIDSELSIGLAHMLREQTGHDVEVAETGMRPVPGRVLLSTSNDHLVMERGGTLGYACEPREMVYRPSVGVFFQSLAAHWTGKGTAVILTGMGRDGAAGMLTLKREGWKTIAQDKATSVVWGMPRAAVELNAAREVLPVSEIGPSIVKHIDEHTSSASERHE